jgi:hypothetical protein
MVTFGKRIALLAIRLLGLTCAAPGGAHALAAAGGPASVRSAAGSAGCTDVLLITVNGSGEPTDLDLSRG